MFGKVGEMKKLYDKYRELQKVLKNLVIRAKQWTYKDDEWNDVEGRVVVEITWEMKLRTVKINDNSLLSIDNKEELEQEIQLAFEKAQTKAQEIVQQKTKEILWFDPSDLANMMWWWMKLPWM